MRDITASVHHGAATFFVVLLLAGAGRGVAQVAPAEERAPVTAQGTTDRSQDRNRFEIYGFVMADMIYDFDQIDPLWFDVVRPTKLPAFEDQFGRDGNFWASVRQSRLGVKAFVPTSMGELRTTFEFELFGTGVDAGQTTIRVRHLYGELGQFGAGQYWSPFMDIDVFPNTIEYWGPTGMAFFRNVQVRWMPIQGPTRLTFALERPGASGDQGNYADRIELENVQGRFPLPDLSGEFRYGGGWGYVELAGIVRYMEIDDLLDDEFALGRSIVGGGGSLSSNIVFNSRRDVLRLQGVYGSAIQNYMNDAPADVGVDETFADPGSPIRGVGLPVLGVVAFLDHSWSDRFSSSIGYSMVDIDNSDGQTDDAFSRGHYAVANLLWYPVKNVMTGGEVQWGRRENFRDGYEVDQFRIQFSAKYNFSFAASTNPEADRQ